MAVLLEELQEGRSDVVGGHASYFTERAFKALRTRSGSNPWVVR
jgi:hypothetical protein